MIIGILSLEVEAGWSEVQTVYWVWGQPELHRTLSQKKTCLFKKANSRTCEIELHASTCHGERWTRLPFTRIVLFSSPFSHEHQEGAYNFMYLGVSDCIHNFYQVTGFFCGTPGVSQEVSWAGRQGLAGTHTAVLYCLSVKELLASRMDGFSWWSLPVCPQLLCFLKPLLLNFFLSQNQPKPCHPMPQNSRLVVYSN